MPDAAIQRSRSYEIMIGPHPVAVRKAPTALFALTEFLRSAGCSDADVVRLGTNRVAWRGAVYQARVFPTPD